MKFKPGDPVWVRTRGIPEATAGEYPAVILGVSTSRGLPWYRIDVITVRGRIWIANERNLRPRRDDYQQHEGLGSRDDLLKPLDETVTIVEIVNEALAEIGK